MTYAILKRHHWSITLCAQRPLASDGHARLCERNGNVSKGFFLCREAGNFTGLTVCCPNDVWMFHNSMVKCGRPFDRAKQTSLNVSCSKIIDIKQIVETYVPCAQFAPLYEHSFVVISRMGQE